MLVLLWFLSSFDTEISYSVYWFFQGPRGLMWWLLSAHCLFRRCSDWAFGVLAAELEPAHVTLLVTVIEDLVGQLPGQYSTAPPAVQLGLCFYGICHLFALSVYGAGFFKLQWFDVVAAVCALPLERCAETNLCVFGACAWRIRGCV
jgi:hypothetical protein